MTATDTAYRSGVTPRRDGFPAMVRAEWTKFRTVRGWVIGMAVAGLVTVLMSLLGTVGNGSPCRSGPNADQPCAPPIGPAGRAVSDRFFFVHQPLEGDGSITVRVTSLTGHLPTGTPGSGGAMPEMRSGVEAWAKAGLIVKATTAQGSSYAAVMATGAHGTRMQYDYTHDTAGNTGLVSAQSPRWLRLTRTGSKITGYESSDGVHWSEVDSVTPAGLPSTVSVGLFVASPDYEVTEQHLGSLGSMSGPTDATAVFDNLTLQGPQPGGTWIGDAVGEGFGAPRGEGQDYNQAAGTFTISGSGDIAPAVGGPDHNTVEGSLVGAFAGLIVMVVLGTRFMTAEYRRGLIRTTLAAYPRRGRMLAAKATVLGVVTFVTGLAASTTAYLLVGHLRRSHGEAILPVSSLTVLRVVVGTALLLAVAAVLALAVGTLLRRSAGAVAAVIVLIVLPYILAVASVLPAGAGNWLLRLTPAAAFAIQQSLPRYSQVNTSGYVPTAGYFPLAPWAGFAVLVAWAALALGLAAVLLRRRDA
ncbi:MAG: ABC transporter permease subunit [Actinomycetota bacterium]